MRLLPRGELLLELGMRPVYVVTGTPGKAFVRRVEAVLGDKNRSGQQYDIWEATYSPMGDDGYPQRLWDKETGKIIQR